MKILMLNRKLKCVNILIENQSSDNSKFYQSMQKVIFIVGLILIVFTTVSCEDFLDPEPDGRRTEEQIFQNYNYAIGYLANIYNDLPGGFHSIDGAMEACMTDDAEHSSVYSGVQQYNNGSWNPTSFPDAYLYSKYYAALRKLSIFIENVDTARFIEPNTYNRSPELNELYQKRYKAESYFLRAFFYFELVKRFGGVPIIPEHRLDLSDNLNRSRRSFDECVDYITTNCDLAAAILPETDSIAELIGHANKASALALKSRTLLYAASPLHNPNGDVAKWEAAALAASEVLKLPHYGLLTGDFNTTLMLDVWSEFYNKEVLFAMPYSVNNNFEYQNFPVGFAGGNGLTNPTQDLVDAFEMGNGIPIDESSRYNPQNPYNRRDKRLKYFIGYNGSLGSKYNDRYLETFVGGLDGLNKDQFATKTGYYIRKFINGSSDLVENTKAMRRSWVHFRYAEILLNYAEAMNEAYGPEGLSGVFTLTALEAVNQVRSRVSQVSIKSPIDRETFRKRLQNERRVELCFEGHRAWDVRRWKQGELFNMPVHGMRITIDTLQSPSEVYEIFEVEERIFDVSKMYFMPIPQNELLKSDSLVQNPNWDIEN